MFVNVQALLHLQPKSFQFSPYDFCCAFTNGKHFRNGTITGASCLLTLFYSPGWDAETKKYVFDDVRTPFQTGEVFFNTGMSVKNKKQALKDVLRDVKAYAVDTGRAVHISPEWSGTIFDPPDQRVGSFEEEIKRAGFVKTREGEFCSDVKACAWAAFH